MASAKSDDIVQAAIRVFSRKGYSGSTVQDVADELGIPKATIYHYVDSKAQLLTTVFTSSTEDMDAILAEVRQAPVSKTDRIGLFIKRYILWSIANLDKASIYTKEWRYTTGELRDTVIVRRAKLTDFLIGLIQEAKDEGLIELEVSPRRASIFIWGTISALPDWYRRDGRDSPETVAEDYVTMTLSALRTLR